MTRRLCLTTTLIFAWSSVAWGNTYFVLPEVVELEAGTTTVVPISSTGGSIYYMELYVALTAPVQLLDLQLGPMWPPGEPLIINSQYGIATASRSPASYIPAGTPLATAVISAPADLPVGSQGLLSLESGWGQSGLLPILNPVVPRPLPTSIIRIVPEPATLCLLACSAVLLRKKRA